MMARWTSYINARHQWMHYQGGITNDALSLLEAAVDRRITSVGVQLADAEEQLKRFHADWAPALNV
jgi:hypothetical protein